MAGYVIGRTAYPSREIAPGLYVVATPIGNLGDITLRALETLASADIIACEDTRVTGRLLHHFAIATRMKAYHDHNAAKAGAKLLEMLREGKRVALTSDAGTPLVSDPGFRLVEAARAESIAVWPIPGPSAPIAALSASGLPSDSFLFDGFLPAKTAKRKARLNELRPLAATLIFFESPNRIAASLADIASEMGTERRLAVCRELTKLHEEILQGTAGELAKQFKARPPRGEIVIVVAPPVSGGAPVADTDALLKELLASASVSRAAAQAAELTGLPRRDLYQRALELSARTKGGQ